MNVFSLNDFDDLKIKLPFPPIIKNIDGLFKIKKNKIPKKPPNAFLIYRNIYLGELKSKNKEIPKMTLLSGTIANSWHCEEYHVKKEYETLAEKVSHRFYELWPKNQNIIKDKITNNRPLKKINHDENFFVHKSDIDNFEEYF